MWARAMRHLILVAALVLGLPGPAQAGIHTANAVSNNSATGEVVHLAQSSLAVIVAPKRIDTETEIVDFTGRAAVWRQIVAAINELQRERPGCRDLIH